MIVYRREGKAFVLFQKRAPEKTIAPDRLDVSVGGHYAAGEDASIAGPREFREELGLAVAFREFVPLGRRLFVYCWTPGVIEQEFQDIFLLPLAAPPEHLVLQPGEVEAVAEVDVDEGIALLSGATAGIGAAVLRRDGTSAREIVSAGDFVPSVDRYYLKLLLLARRYLAGERTALAI